MTTVAAARDVRYGEGAIGRTADIVAASGARRVLLVCGASSFEASGAAAILPDLARVAEVRRWSDFAPNPDATDLLDGLRLVDQLHPEMVLGVGGGSAMDMAKLLVGLTSLVDGSELHRAIRSGQPVTSRQARLMLAPTTSGSGSEATHFAVVYLGAGKFSVAGPVLRPDVVVLDPALTVSGSRYQRATSGIDAVAQAVESLWAVGATAASRRWARHALRLLLPAIERHVEAPGGEATRAMAIGSHLAGRAIDISRTTAAHALSYGITKRYGVSHGHAVALTLGVFLEAHVDVAPGRLRAGVDPSSHAAAMAEILRRFGARDGRQARRELDALLRRLGLETSLSSVGAHTPGQRAALAAAVNTERLGNNPVAFTGAELTRLVMEIE